MGHTRTLKNINVNMTQWGGSIPEIKHLLSLQQHQIVIHHKSDQLQSFYHISQIAWINYICSDGNNGFYSSYNLSAFSRCTWLAASGETGSIGQGVGTFREGPHRTPGLSVVPRTALLKGLDLYFLGWQGQAKHV